MSVGIPQNESAVGRGRWNFPEDPGDGPLGLNEDFVAALLCDPVMAASVLMGAELDEFQRVRLRYMWFFPELIDSSGVSTAKSEVVFIWANLIAMLLVNPEGEAKRKVVIFYQTLAVAEDTFWAKYDKYFERSALFRAQIKPGRAGKLGKSEKNGKVMQFWNGNTVQIMAGAFNRDSDSLASMRCTDAAVDEYTVVDKMGRGIDLQLRDRATAATFNKNHPLWSNKLSLLGHAEGSDHPSAKRVRVQKKAIRDGSFGHGLFTACYLDYTKDYQKYLDGKAMKRAKVSLSVAEFDWQWLGVNRGGSRGYYGSAATENCRSSHVGVEFASSHESFIYTAGGDVSYGTGQQIDDNAVIVLRSRYLGSSPPSSMRGVTTIHEEDFDSPHYWEVQPVWAIIMSGQSVDQYSGVIHLLHRNYGLSLFMMDPAGGGGFVYRKVVDKQQLIRGRFEETRGLCLEEHSHLYPDADPVFRFFKRGDALLDPLWDERERRGDEGIIEASHRCLSHALINGNVLFPQPLDEVPQEDRLRLTSDERQVRAFLDTVMKQVGNVHVITNTKGETKFNSRGFRMFKARGKKDGAYALLYGYMGTIAYLTQYTRDFIESGEIEGSAIVV